MGQRVVTAQRHEADDVSWAFARCLPHPALSDDVVGYTGYAEHAVAPMRRREVPAPRVPVIVSFGDTIEVVDGAGRFSPQPLTSFVAGFSDGHAVTEYVGRQRGVQIDLTPLGAYRLLGLAGAELCSGVLDLHSVLGAPADRLVEQLAAAPDWPARFELVDAALLRRRERAPAVDDAVGWAWRRLVATGGLVPVGALVDDIGCSRRHFVQRFRRHAGLGPKASARVLRFDRAVRLLGSARSISDVAADTGYADHSHLVREFRSMAGCTPTELRVERGLPSTFRPDEIEVT
ncbi:AraC family transcriptional regulator [Haloactinopolyspora alba]|uniref:AraC family transcriptional regulator n=1 Tax=Haloactinopolyspora alba TaxID=648780 RepID=A0A2P8DVB6_9ACTN|nr:helix-turn-helix domain-containing protein [Haloactinopolyspora alba]PSL01144.1 AraC family transcriptional regulator [Haloactinopolyspora alba]